MPTMNDVLSSNARWAIVDVELPYDPAWVNLDEPLETQFPPGPYRDAVRRALGKYPMPSLVVNPIDTRKAP